MVPVPLLKTTKSVGFIDLASYPRVPHIAKAIGGAVEAGLCKDLAKPFWCGAVKSDALIAHNNTKHEGADGQYCAASLDACVTSRSDWSSDKLALEGSYTRLKDAVIADGTALKVAAVVASSNQKQADKARALILELMITLHP